MIAEEKTRTQARSVWPPLDGQRNVSGKWIVKLGLHCEMGTDA